MAYQKMPKNRNLDRGQWIGDASNTVRRKVGWFGTSQSEQNSVRFGGHIPMQIAAAVTGLMAYGLNQQSAGINHLGATVTGMTTRNPQPATSASDANARWGGDSNESDNLGYSLEIAMASNVAVDTRLRTISLTAPHLFNDLEIEDRWIARMIYRNESTNASNIKSAPYSGGSYGTLAAYTFPAVELPGTIETVDLPLPAVADFGSPGHTTRGVTISAGTGDDTGKYHQIIGTPFLRSDNGVDLVDHGLMFVPVFQGGYSAYDHLNRISQAARRAMIGAFEGLDEVWIEIGHNTEDSGRTVDNVKLLAKQIKLDHKALGLPIPKIGIVIPWKSAGAPGWTEAKAQRMDLMAQEEKWGCVNFWAICNGLSPSQNGKDYFGNARTYTMDGSDLHPGISTTAEYLAEDFLSAFKAGQRVSSYTHLDAGVVSL